MTFLINITVKVYLDRLKKMSLLTFNKKLFKRTTCIKNPIFLFFHWSYRTKDPTCIFRVRGSFWRSCLIYYMHLCQYAVERWLTQIMILISIVKEISYLLGINFRDWIKKYTCQPLEWRNFKRKVFRNSQLQKCQVIWVKDLFFRWW